MKIFTVYDFKVRHFLPPQFYRNAGEALRAFQLSCENQESQFNKFPKDFTLYEIGEWNDETGEILMLDKHKPLSSAYDYVTEHAVDTFENIRKNGWTPDQATQDQ